ncbi:Nn.00g097290.m01.CDS01 [Neocucurbitaria sp. VM-36]
MDSDAVPPSSPPNASATGALNSPFFEPQDGAFSPKSSSPPPLFSSDDSRESVDVTNYESPRVYKNKRKGTWWDNRESAHNTPEPKKTKISRNYDSGVYMLSDATDSSDDLLPQHKSPFAFPMEGASEELPQISRAEADFCAQLRTGVEKNSEIYEWRGLGLQDSDIAEIGGLASVIKISPDAGNELPAEGQYRSMVPELYIDLTQNSLCRLTPSLFDVHSLTTLIMRDNLIEELPQQIGQLRNLQTLDVSLNKLKCLPFELLQLLQPYGSLQRLTTIGNPLLEPMSSARFSAGHARSEPHSMFFTDSFHEDLDLHQYEATEQLPDLYDSLDSCSDPEQAIWRIRCFESWSNAFGGDERDEAEDGLEDDGYYGHHSTLHIDDVVSVTPRYIARTLVSFFDQAGNLIHGSPIQPTSNDKEYPVIIETNRGTYGAPSSPFSPPSTSRVASLITTSLHNAFKQRRNDDLTIEYLRDMLPDPIPHEVNAIFARALANDKGGYGEFRQCHVCSKDYVVARAEWIEFWSAGYGVFYPLRVKACSWGCVPEEMMERPEKVLAW